MRRVNWIIVFGEGTNRWQMTDPGSKRAVRADRAYRYGSGATRDDVAVLASVRSCFAYLVHDCPTTKLACEKLAKLRAAVRALPEPDDDEPCLPQQANPSRKGAT
jgi:hypothetical protein